MHVYLAAQVCAAPGLVQFHNCVFFQKVLSKKTGQTMLDDGPPNSEETAKFILMTDRFFDCLNGISNSDSKPDRRGYYSTDDPRFEVWFT
jgi:hypothetical protein